MEIFNSKLKRCNQKGFGMIEVVVASSVFAILVATFVGLLSYSYRVDRGAGDRNRAVFLADEGLEIVRSIRDNDFYDLSDGTHGTTNSSGVWELSGSSDGIDEFTRRIEISSVNENTKEVVSAVEWLEGDLDKIVSLVARFTNWKEIVAIQGDYLNVDYSNATWSIDEKELLGLTLENTGDNEIVIDKIIVSWTGNQRIEEVEIDANVAWSHSGAGSPNGKQDSGTELDIVDVAMSPGDTFDVDKIEFSKAMAGETVDIVFIMIDGTQKELIGISP